MRTPSPKHNSQLQMPIHYGSSPPKAYGSKINVNGDFGTVARGNGVVLDKSLLCKALFDAGRTAICVCLPRRFGKTFNLSVLEEFFNVLHGDDAAVVNGAIDKKAAHHNRDMALDLYKLLQSTLVDTFCGKCIVLLDEYDTPLIDIRGKAWEEDAKKNYINLLNFIFKDNRNLRAGVLVGVHYVELSDLYSGANNIDVLPLTVMEECRQDTGQTDGTELDCFGELFAFTKPEVEALVNEVHQKYPAI
ncbi:hypothetical protein IWW36_004950, partial [Coemansia brasiliensis]